MNKNIAKSRILENKADKFRSKNKFKKAIDNYLKALELDETRIELYDKLIQTHEHSIDKWTEEDFAFNLHLTMSKQEILDPTFKRLHARHEPEFKEVVSIIQKMLNTNDPAEETKYVEEITAYDTDALYPLIDFILSIKEATYKSGVSTPDKQKKPTES